MRFHIYSEPGVSIWDWNTTGGSEGYHIELGRRLAARGHEVVSFANVGFEGETTVDGVTWTHARNAMSSLDIDAVWIIQRSPELGYDVRFANPDAVVLFSAHDLDYPSRPKSPHWSWMYDAILAESNVHARYLQLNFGKELLNNIVVSGTGFAMENIDSLDFSHRDPKTIFHAANPTRGLLQLLTIFRRAYDDDCGLKLRISYGMEYLNDLIAARKDFDGKLKILRDKIMRLIDHPGITYLGRLATCREVWQEHAKAGMYLYPTLYPEISCQNIMEAQALGAIPVVSPTMALAETVLHGIKIAGDVEQDRMIQARFVREIVALANNPDIQDKIRVPMMAEARAKYNFSDVVDRVECLASDLIERKSQVEVEVGA